MQERKLCYASFFLRIFMLQLLRAGFSEDNTWLFCCFALSLGLEKKDMKC